MAIDDFSIESSINHSNGRWNRLVPLDHTDSNYSQVEKLFSKGWKHKEKTKPRLHAVFKIVSSEENLKPYLEYRERVRSSPSLSRSSTPGNECLLFHGTNRACRLGEDSSNVRLCGLPECFLCCILRSSFDIRKSGSKHKFRRFGTGIYTTACSSKADDYAFDAMEDTRFRVLLLNRVVVGKALKRRKNATDLMEPPCGYHSVIGEPGEDLNYEETVVYTSDALRPAYLVVYGNTNAPEADSKLRAIVQALFKTPLAS